MERVFMGIPSLDGKFDARFMDSLLRTMRAGLEKGLDILPYYVTNDPFIHRVRNDIFHTAYHSKIENCFFIDSDMVWEPSDFFKLFLSNEDVIGASYVIKDDHIDRDRKIRYVGIDEKDKPDERGLLETTWMGLGFTRIKRKVLADLYENSLPFFDRRDGIEKRRIFSMEYTPENELLGEDVLLLKKINELGYKTYIDTNINIGHIGTKVYRGNLKECLDAGNN